MSDLEKAYYDAEFKARHPDFVPEAAAITHDGLPAVKNADGSHSTELSITVTDPRLNGGRPTNIPSLWGGEVLNEDQAVKKAIESGRGFEAYASIDEAVNAAKQRSAMGGAMAASGAKKPTGRGPHAGGGPEAPALALMDMMAGLLKGSVAATLGLPGDMESLVRLLSGGKQVLPTTEDMSAKLPDVVPPGGSADRQHNADIGTTIGELVPLPLIGAGKVLKAAAKGAAKKAAPAAAAATAATPAPAGTSDRVIMYDASGKRIGTLDNIKGGPKPAPVKPSKPRPTNSTARG